MFSRIRFAPPSNLPYSFGVCFSLIFSQPCRFLPSLSTNRIKPVPYFPLFSGSKFRHRPRSARSVCFHLNPTLFLCFHYPHSLLPVKLSKLFPNVFCVCRPVVQPVSLMRFTLFRRQFLFLRALGHSPRGRSCFHSHSLRQRHHVQSRRRFPTRVTGINLHPTQRHIFHHQN